MTQADLSSKGSLQDEREVTPATQRHVRCDYVLGRVPDPSQRPVIRQTKLTLIPVSAIRDPEKSGRQGLMSLPSSDSPDLAGRTAMTRDRQGSPEHPPRSGRHQHHDSDSERC